MGTRSGREWTLEGLSPVLLLLRSTDRQHVYSVGTIRRQPACYCRTLLALLCGSHPGTCLNQKGGVSVLLRRKNRHGCSPRFLSRKQMIFRQPMILGVAGAVAYFIIISEESPLPIWVAYIYFPVLGFVLASLFCVSCQDPGLMERVTDEEAGEGGWFWNEQVGSFRPPGALYCRECGVLIQDYDHLCPWTGTGIGRQNIMAFKMFVVGVNVLCYFSIILVIVALLKGLRAPA